MTTSAFKYQKRFCIGLRGTSERQNGKYPVFLVGEKVMIKTKSFLTLSTIYTNLRTGFYVQL